MVERRKPQTEPPEENPVAVQLYEINRTLNLILSQLQIIAKPFPQRSSPEQD
jgi:hypothetical protein